MSSKKQFGVIEPNDMNDIIYNGGKKVFISGIRVPYMPKPTDCWSNPYDEYKNGRVKSGAWREAVDNNEFALDSQGNKHPLKDYSIEQLAFVSGFWRIQDKLPHKITHVRDQDMVLIKKLDHEENTLFEFYKAKHVSYNCYGPFILDCPETDYIVTKYETDNGTYWGYGKTIEAARAYLGIKMYDEYKGLINAVACKNKMKRK